MNIRVNEAITLSADANGGHFIITGVTGLGSADIRSSSFLFSGRSGGMVTDQFYGFRIITITGEIGANDMTPAQHKIDRAALQAAMPVGETFPIDITLFNGETYTTEVSLTDLKLEYKQRGYRSEFLIQFTAGDPLFYSTDDGDIQTAHITRVTQGGYVTPYDLPVNWASGSSPTVVTNSGEAMYLPRIEIHDQADNPVITNQTTGERFEIDINLVDGDELVIDMQKRSLKLNGASVIGNKTNDSIWWGLAVGPNSIVLDSASGSDNVTADIYWRNGVRGL